MFFINHIEFGHIFITGTCPFHAKKKKEKKREKKKDFYGTNENGRQCQVLFCKFGRIVNKPSLPYTIILNVLESRIPK